MALTDPADLDVMRFDDHSPPSRSAPSTHRAPDDCAWEDGCLEEVPGGVQGPLERVETPSAVIPRLHRLTLPPPPPPEADLAGVVVVLAVLPLDEPLATGSTGLGVSGEGSTRDRQGIPVSGHPRDPAQTTLAPSRPTPAGRDSGKRDHGPRLRPRPRLPLLLVPRGFTTPGRRRPPGGPGRVPPPPRGTHPRPDAPPGTAQGSAPPRPGLALDDRASGRSAGTSASPRPTMSTRRHSSVWTSSCDG